MLVLERIALFAEPVGLALVLVYTYSFFGSSRWNQHLVHLIMGGIFGLSAVYAMSNPIPIAEGVIIDIRNLFVGLAAAFFGLIGGFVALVLGGLTRLYVGGTGAVSGLMGMSIAVVMGLVWAHWVRPRMSGNNRAFLILGAMITAHLAAVIALPKDLQAKILMDLGPVFFAANVFGALLLGKLLTREQKLMKEREELRSAVTIDPLTQLLNRSAALNTYDGMRDRRVGSDGTAMLCIDVDHFKRINDTHGHLRGDQVLVEIAKRMSLCLRPEDIFARMSGDEFVIVLDNLTSEHAEAVAQRCRKTISATPIIADGAEIHTSVSIGCAWLSERPNFSDLRTAADQVLYRAKEEGRDRMAFEKFKQSALPSLEPQAVAV